MKFSVSILSTNNKKEAINLLNNTDASFLHLDVMDGIFVENSAFDINEINEILKLSKKKVDIHLMVSDPISYIEKIDDFTNIYGITFHIEIDKDIKKIINYVKSMNVNCGLSLNPDTKIEKIIPYLNDIDMVLVMSVHPGKGGQTFIFDILNKIEGLRKYNEAIILMVDGGINQDNILKLKSLNVDVAVVGSFITKNEFYQENLNLLK